MASSKMVFSASDGVYSVSKSVSPMGISSLGTIRSTPNANRKDHDFAALGESILTAQG